MLDNMAGFPNDDLLELRTSILNHDYSRERTSPLMRARYRRNQDLLVIVEAELTKRGLSNDVTPIH